MDLHVFLRLFEVRYQALDQRAIFQKTQEFIKYMDNNFLLPGIQDCVERLNEDVSNDSPGAFDTSSFNRTHQNLFGFNFNVATTSQARELAKSNLDLFRKANVGAEVGECSNPLD